jgi:hypothetical protein
VISDEELEASIRATLHEAIPKLVEGHRYPIPDPRTGRRRPWRSPALVAATTAVLVAGGVLFLGWNEPTDLPPTETGTVDTTNSTVPTTTASTPPTTVPEPTTTSTIESRAGGFGLVDAKNSTALGQDEAEAWGRLYLDLLAQGDYESAAVLLAADGYTSRSSPERDDLAPAATQVTDRLPQQLAAYCESDGFCLPAYDVVPNDLALMCGTEEPCDATERAYFDRFNDGWMFRYSLAAEDGTPARFDPTSVGPITANVVVGATDGRVYVRWVPPSLRSGDPARWLPPMQLPSEPIEFEVNLPEDVRRFRSSSDGSSLCVGIDGGSICTDPLAPPHAYVSGAVSRDGDADQDTIHMFAVASTVTVEMRDSTTGQPYELVDRIETTVGDVTVWLFRGPRRGVVPQLNFTLQSGATFESLQL